METSNGNVIPFRKETPLATLNADDIFAAGREAEKRKDFPEALKCYEKLMQMGKCIVAAELNLSRIHFLQGDRDLAELEVREVLELDWGYYLAHFNLGTYIEADEKRDRTVEAIKHYQACLQFNPDYRDAHCNLGGIYRRKGNIPKTLWHYRQFIETVPLGAEDDVDLQEMKRYVIEQQTYLCEVVAFPRSAPRPRSTSARRRVRGGLAS